MVDVDSLSDAELRTKLLEFGFPVMPITGTTRKVMAKKLKMLLENKNKIASDGRRSLGRYSSEEESDTDVKQAKKERNRRVTMAAPSMPAPTGKPRRNIRNEEPVEPDLPPSPRRRDIKSSTSSTTTRTHRIVKSAQDEFDTGSESESDVAMASKLLSATNDIGYSSGSPLKTSSSHTSSVTYSPQFSETSYTSTRNTSYKAPSPSRLSYASPSSASDYAENRLNQIRQRLSLGSPTSYEKPYVSSEAEKVETPFLSNFTKRLSSMSTRKPDYLSGDDIIKEHDTNGASSYARSYLSKSTRGRDTIYNYRNPQNSIIKNNLVSFAVLAGAALFFIFLTIIYLGMRSDTSVASSGVVVPHCNKDNLESKRGINCVNEDDVETALHLLSVLKPELTKRTIANKCFDPTIKPHMTEEEIVTFCYSNFGIKDKVQIRKDLRTLELLSFVNPDWGINVVQKDDNNGIVNEEHITKNMEQVVFHMERITSLVIFNPELPWKCTMYNTFSHILRTVLFIGIVFSILYCLNFGYKYYKNYTEREQNEVSCLVEKIIDILESNESDDPNGNFLVINHVRDMILPVQDRKTKEKTWLKAVKYINENESRVRTEVQTVAGETYDVWRWIDYSNLSMTRSNRQNKSWQGQAFDMTAGSVNTPPCSPTPCLKVRGMVEEGERLADASVVREAVLSKCAHRCRILHCDVDAATGCVYVKCAGTEDASVAYRNLHGWWYAGQLVTVKYLRLERYMQRFPDSPVHGPPFLKAAKPELD